jgi:hypothetical protein
MEKRFGQYSTTVPMALTWVEQITLYQDEEQTMPVDLTGLAARAQLRLTKCTYVDPIAGAPNPVLELTTPNYYGPTPPEVPVPAWPVLAVLSIPTPANGTILLDALKSQYVRYLSPTNAKVKYYWQIVLVNQETLDYAPVVEGAVVLLPATTL